MGAESLYPEYLRDHLEIKDENVKYFVSIFTDNTESCTRIITYNDNSYNRCLYAINWATQGYENGTSKDVNAAIDEIIKCPLTDSVDRAEKQALISYKVDGKWVIHWFNQVHFDVVNGIIANDLTKH